MSSPFDDIMNDANKALDPGFSLDFTKLSAGDALWLAAWGAMVKDGDFSALIRMVEIFNKAASVDLFALPADRLSDALKTIAEEYVEWGKEHGLGGTQ